MGLICVEVEGLNLTRLFDRLVANQIQMHDVKRHHFQRLTFKIGGHDRKKLFALANEKCYNVVITHDVGLKPFLKWLLQKSGMVAGLFAVTIALFAYGSMLWRIEIGGTQRVDAAEIESVLLENGIKKGMSLKRIDRVALETEISKHPDIAAASVAIKGTRLVVSVNEVLDYEQSIDLNQPRSIFADCDGIVREVLVLAGTAVVEVGEVIKAGDLLIEGVSRNTAGEPMRECRAIGRVTVSSYLFDEVFYSLTETGFERTGKKKTTRQISIFGKPFPKEKAPKSPFLNFETETSTRMLFYGEVLPFRVTTTTFFECAKFERTLTEEEAAKRNEQRLYKKMTADLKDRVLGQSSVVTKTNGLFRLQLFLETEKIFD